MLILKQFSNYPSDKHLSACYKRGKRAKCISKIVKLSGGGARKTTLRNRQARHGCGAEK